MAINDVGIKITAQDQTGNAFNSVTSKLNAIKSEASGLGETVGGLVEKFSALGLVMGTGLSLASVKAAIDTADEFSKMAQKTGVAVEALRQLNYAASLSDVSTEALGTGLRKLSINMAAAAGGSKQQADTFKALGLSAKDASGNLKSVDTMLSDVAAKFANYKDGPEKAALAVELFGKAGADMIPLLNAGATGLKDMADEATALGAVFSGDMAKQSEAFNDNLTRIATVSKSAVYSIATELLPTLNLLAQAFLDANKSGTGFAAVFGSVINETVKLTALGIASISTGLKAVGREIGGIFAKFSAMGEGGGIFTKTGRAAWGSVSDSIKEDHETARRSLQKFQTDLYPSETRARDLKYSQHQGLGEILGNTQTTAPIVDAGAAAAAAAKPISEAAKGLALYNDLMDKAAGFEKTWTEDTNKLRAALDGKTISQDQFTKAVQVLFAKQPMMVAAAKAEADAQKEAAKAYDDAYTAQAKQATSAQDALAKQLDQNAAIGLSVTALADLEAAKLTDQAINKDSLATTADLIDFSGQLGNKYREEAQALRDLASAKISGSQKRATYDAAQDQIKEQKRAAEESAKAWEDALMRGFEAGKGFAENLRDTVVNMFKNMVLRPVISAIMSPVSMVGSTLLGSMGTAAAGGAAGTAGSGLLGSLAGSAIMTTATSWGTAAGAGFMATLGGSSLSGGSAAGILATGGAAGAGTAGMIGAAVPYVAAALAAYALLKGGGESQTGAGVTGKFGATGFTGNSYAEMTNKPSVLRSLFGANDNVYKNLTPLDSKTQFELSSAFDAMKAQTTAFAQALGLSADTVAGYSKDITLAFTADEAKNKQLIADMFTGIAAEMANLAMGNTSTSTTRTVTRRVVDQAASWSGREVDSWVDEVWHEVTDTITEATTTASVYAKGLETADQTLARLAASLVLVNAAFDDLGYTLLSKDLAGAAKASNVIDAFGGVDPAKSALTGYYEAFYSEADKIANLTRHTSDAFAGIGKVMPEVNAGLRDWYRATVDDLATKDMAVRANAAAYASAVMLYGAIDKLSPAMQDAASSLTTSLADMKAKVLGDANKVTSALRSIGNDVQSLADAATSAQADLRGARNNISEALWAAQDRVAELQKQAADGLRIFTASIDDFLNTIDPATNSTASLQSLKAQLSSTAVLASGGDAGAQGQVLAQAQAVLKVAQAGSTSALEYARSEAFVRTTLKSVKQAVNPAPIVEAVAVAIVDPLVAAQNAVQAYVLLAQQTGAETDRATRHAADSVVSLSSAYVTAMLANIRAQNDYQAALTVTAGLTLTTNTRFDTLNADLLSYNAANVTLSESVAKLTTSLGLPDMPAEDLAAYLGLAGQAAADFVKIINNMRTSVPPVVEPAPVGQYSTAQVASYIQDNQLSVDSLVNTASVFGLTDAQVKAAQELLASGNTASVDAAHAAYIESATPANLVDNAVASVSAGLDPIVPGTNYRMSELISAVSASASQGYDVTAMIEGASRYGVSETDVRAAGRILGLQGYATGTNYMMQDGPVYAHKGEQITPRHYVDIERNARDETNALMARLVASNERLEAKVAALQKAAEGTEKNTSNTANSLNTVTRGGRAMQTEAFT